jgi:hypothetical protein
MDLEEELRRRAFKKPSFAYNRVVGNLGKELVRALLESCEYSVYPFGYESYLTHIKDLIHTRRLEKTPLLQRMPDLLVMDEEEETLKLVEVITRSSRLPNDVDIEKSKLEDLKKFWNSSILAVVLPKSKRVFYAEKVTKLEITDAEFVNFDISNSPINKRFPRVRRGSGCLKELQDLCKTLFSGL